MDDVIDLTGSDSTPGPAAALKRAAPAPSGGTAPAAAVKKPKAAAAPKPRAAHALLWIPYTCKGGKKARWGGPPEDGEEAENDDFPFAHVERAIVYRHGGGGESYGRWSACVAGREAVYSKIGSSALSCVCAHRN